jgi:macrolide transport system ATP-binding/permease protein
MRPEHWRYTIPLRLRSIFRRRQADEQLDDELRDHLELAITEYIARGMDPEKARRQARLDLGGLEKVKEECRDARRTNAIENFFRDLRFGLRMMRKSIGFSSVAILTLALGIAVNTAVFTAFDAFVLRPRAVADPDRLAFVFRATEDDAHGRFSYPAYLFYRDHSKSFSDLGLFAFGMAVTSSDLPPNDKAPESRVAGALRLQLPQLLPGSAQPLMCFFVSGNYFKMLGAMPLQGRLIEPLDDVSAAAPVVLMSGNLWQNEFHSDPRVLGAVVHLNGVPFTIVGITAPDYKGMGPDVPSLWAPVAARVRLGSVSAEEMQNRHVIVGEPQGRLRPNVSFSEAQAELGVLAAQWRAAHPEDTERELIRVIPAKNDLALLGLTEWELIVASMAAVGLLLLIGCANVAGLMLVRASARRKEIAVRLALGAGRGRVLRQLLTESLLVGVLAGGLGLPLAIWMLHLLMVEIISVVPSFWGSIALTLTPDIRIFTYTLLISCAAGVSFGLIPALLASKVDVNDAIKEEGSAVGSAMSRSKFRGLLIATQMAACLVLLINSALLLRGSQKAVTINPGYELQKVAYLELYNPEQLHYSRARLQQLDEDLLRGIGSVAGVTSVAQASRGPIGNTRWIDVTPFDSDLTPSDRANQSLGAGYSYVAPNYFQTMGIPILRGRAFTAGESETQAPVVVISESTARRFWPGQDSIGRRLKIGSQTEGMSFPGEAGPVLRSCEVIGIAGDVRSMDLTKIDESYLYLPLSQKRQSTNVFLARTEGDPATLLPTIGEQVRRVDPSLPVVGAPLTMMLSMDPYFVASRVGGVLASVVGALGLFMACMGIYGMVSYSVAERTREIGIRMALGAGRQQLLRMVMTQGFRPIFVGTVIGVVASAGISRVLAAMMFGFDSGDGILFFTVSLALAAIAVVATYVPARRAMQVDPQVALRHE